jgi:SAM-dependent methyltransferase
MSQVELMMRAAAKKTVGGVNRAIAPFVRFPVPPYGLMRRTGAKSLWHYWDGGIRSYLPIAVLAEHYGIDLRSPAAVLDFGCGVGRQLLHFTRDYPRARYAACDVHPQYVDFVTRAYPQVAASVSAFNPPLTYADDQFDMLYSVSVFSHLPPDTHGPWLKELSRVVKPGAHAFLTIEGATAVRKTMARKVWGENPDEAVAALERDGVRFSEYRDLAWQKTHEGEGFVGMKYGGVRGSYGSTAMTPDHVRQHWSASGFDVVAVVEGVIGRRQDVVVLRAL